jgi:hypothetical protein
LSEVLQIVTDLNWRLRSFSILRNGHHSAAEVKTVPGWLRLSSRWSQPVASRGPGLLIGALDLYYCL